MQKAGHPLREIAGFDQNLVARLRDELSVTTAEEFVGLWHSSPVELSNMLGGEQRTSGLALLAKSALSKEEIESLTRSENSDYPFKTGHEAPPSGKQTF